MIALFAVLRKDSKLIILFNFILLEYDDSYK